MKSFYISILFFVLSYVAAGDDDTECVYTLYVKTSDKLFAGTNSNIRIDLLDKDGTFVTVQDLTTWGIMEGKHHYFRRGNLDKFVIRGTCINGPVCRIKLTSDDKGIFSAWICEYVEVTCAGVDTSCSQSHFNVNQKLNKKSLTAEINMCDSLEEHLMPETEGTVISKNHKGFTAA